MPRRSDWRDFARVVLQQNTHGLGSGRIHQVQLQRKRLVGVKLKLAQSLIPLRDIQIKDHPLRHHYGPVKREQEVTSRVIALYQQMPRRSRDVLRDVDQSDNAALSRPQALHAVRRHGDAAVG